MKSGILAVAMLVATMTGAYATQYYVYAPSSGGCTVVDNAGTPGPNRKMKFEGKAFELGRCRQRSHSVRGFVPRYEQIRIVPKGAITGRLILRAAWSQLAL